MIWNPTRTTVGEEQSAKLAGEIGNYARKLENDDDLTPLIQRIGEARFVLLGEASHGTSEYYTSRAPQPALDSRKEFLVYRRGTRLAGLL